MEVVEFFVPGEPKPQGRPRTFQGKDGKIVTWGSSARVRNWRDRIHVHALGYAPSGPSEAPLSFTAVFLFARPDSHYTSKGELSATGRRRPRPTGGVGDLDNLWKAVADALEGVFFKRDSQITSAHVVKAYCGRGAQEGVVITIREEEST